MAVDDTRPGFVRKRKRLLIIAVLVVAVAGFVVPRISKREPLYKGKPISYWVDQACRGYGRAEAYQARLEVKNIGPAAVPYLVKRLRTSDGWRGKWFWIRAHLPEPLQGDLSNFLLPGEMRVGAALTLQLLGPDAKAAVPDLIQLVPRSDSLAQTLAVQTLMFIGPDAGDALPALHSLLNNTTNISRRVAIAGALWYIGRETNLVFQICTNALVPNSGDDAINATSHLTQLGRAAAPAVPLALTVLQDTNRHEGARANAATFIDNAGISSPEILTALADGTRPQQPERVRSCCAAALCRFDRQYAPLATRLAIQFLTRNSNNKPPNFGPWMRWTGLDPEDCLPTLTELLQDDSPDIRNAAAAAIETIREQNKLQKKP